MSALESSKDAMEKGAIDFTTKPVTPEQLDTAFNNIETFIQKDMRELLIVEDDPNLRKTIRKLIGEKGINITEATTGKETLKKLKETIFDCMILDLGLPDMTGFELLKKIEKDKMLNAPPVIVYTGREITKEENDELAVYANSIIIKGVRSADRLLDETALFMHRVVKELPEQQQNIIGSLHEKDRIFKNKKVLIVDDEMRNVFALSKVLTEKNIIVLKAENGKIGIERLEQNPDIDIILMDIMMPVMDGYEAMNKIRQNARFKDIPIIALTAKAMKNDAEKCMNAGASDYLSKPLDVDKLFTLMKVWLY
jgi:CheY-like chemotaxis protein